MDGTLHKPATSVVETAILLASSGVFDLGHPRPKSDPGPLTRVGGLTLFQRAVLTLQRAGISQIWILVGEDEQHLRSLVHGDPRIQTALRWLPIREFPPANPQTWETLAGEVKGSCLIVGCHTVFSPSFIQSLRMVGSDGRVLVVVGQPGEGKFTGNPGVTFREDLRESGGNGVLFHDRAETGMAQVDGRREGLPVVGDLLVLPSRLLGVSGILQAPGANPLRLALEQAAIEGVIQPISSHPSQFRDVRGPNGPQLAEQSLFQALQTLKGGLDGMIDRYVNRKLSGLFTRLFLQIGMSPNAITVVSMMIGLAAAGCFATGSYTVGLLGALFFQLSVIIDCCDGEVARLTFAESRFGQELDIWADNVVHMAIFAGIAWGAYLHGPWQGTSLPLILGLAAVAANGLSLGLVNRARTLRAQPRLLSRLSKAERTNMEFLLGNVANRDFSVIVMACAVFDILGWFLWLAAAGAWFFVATMGWILRRVLFARA